MKSNPNNYEDAVKILSELQSEVSQEGLNKNSEKKDAMRDKFNNTIVGTDGNGRLQHNFHIKLKDGSQVDHLCRDAWAAAHGVKSGMIDCLSAEHKVGVKTADRSLGTRSHAVRTVKELKRILADNNIEIDQRYLRAGVLDGSEAQYECCNWFDEFFKFSGDHMPNSNQIHIDNCPIKTLYKQYADECIFKVSYKVWKGIWSELFSHVKMRVYKSVTGKCKVCALLSGVRSKFKHPSLKKMATELHELHRSFYMAERQAYYEKKREALENPDEVMSVILDGMAQSHTCLPHYANQYSTVTLQQKLQGVIDHGRETFDIYLAQHSCPGGINLALHTFFLTLGKWVEEKKRFPSKIYWQIDGGPENATRHTYAFAEYLVSQTPIQEITVARLPVGHTHEDIDARFGNIWDHVKMRYNISNHLYLILSFITYLFVFSSIYTPQDYYKKLVTAFPTKTAHVTPVFAVPNYEVFFEGFIDRRFAAFAKEYDTKLVFKFEKCNDEIRYPLGVKYTYRAYTQDLVILIIDAETIPLEKRSDVGKKLNLQAIDVEVTCEPQHNGRVSGRCLLQTLPDVPITPAELVERSRLHLNAVKNVIRNKFGEKSSQLMAWTSWDIELAPQNDIVVDYFRDHPPAYPASFEPLFVRPGTGGVSADQYNVAKKRVRETLSSEGRLRAVTTDSCRATGNETYVAPYVWKDTGLPVFARRKRAKKVVDKLKCVEKCDDILIARDYTKLTNADLQSLICDVNSQFGTKFTKLGNKDTLVKNLTLAVQIARKKREELGGKADGDGNDDDHEGDGNDDDHEGDGNDDDHEGDGNDDDHESDGNDDDHEGDGNDDDLESDCNDDDLESDGNDE